MKSLKTGNIAVYLFLASIVIYFCQGSLYANGSVISQGAMAIWMLINITYLIKYASKFKLLFFEKIIFWFWFINTCYWIFSDKVLMSAWYEPLSTMNNFKSIFCTFLTYFPVRYFTRKDILTEKLLSYFAAIMLVVFILSFLSFEAQIMYELNREAVTNNMGYRFVALLPLLAIFRKIKFTYISVFIASYFIILSSKRGAILCGALFFILLFYYSFKNIPRKKKLIYSILILGIFSISVYYLTDIFISNEYLMMRLTNMEAGVDDSGDARVNQVSAIVEYTTNGSIFHFLFGYGFDKSVMIAGNYAHNDWAELLANLGVFGCVLYLIFFTSLIKIFTKNKNLLEPMLKLMFVSVLSCWLLVSMFSMGYISNNSFLYTLVIAYLVSKIEKDKKACQR